MVELPRNHGKLWSVVDRLIIAREYMRGSPTVSIAVAVGRKRDAVEAKLNDFGLMGMDQYYRVGPLPEPARRRGYERLVRKIEAGFPSQITAELLALEFLPDEYTAKYGTSQPTTPATSTTSETTMTKLIEIKTLINGQDISTMEDRDLYRVIAKTEQEIKQLEAIEHKPKKLVKLIEDLKRDIGTLVALIDNESK